LEKYVKNQVKWMILGYLRNLGKPQWWTMSGFQQQNLWEAIKVVNPIT
jgi:hypothetical protein